MLKKNSIYFKISFLVTFLFFIGGITFFVFCEGGAYNLKGVVFKENSEEMGFGEFDKIFVNGDLEESDTKGMARVMGSTAMGVLDFNNDGFMDLVVPDRNPDTGDVYINNEGKEFVRMAPGTDVDQFGFVLSVGGFFSFDKDRQEVVLGTLEKVHVISYVENEFAVNNVIEVPNVFAQTYGDVDADGYVDMFLSSWGSNEGGLYWGGENGYVDSGMTHSTEDIDWRERPKRCVEANENMTEMAEDFLQRTNINFDSIFVDYTGDGWIDLLVAGDFNTTGVYKNEGGVLVKTKHTPLECNAMGADVGDLNNDGLLEWFITSIYDPEAKEEGKPWGGEGNMVYSLNKEMEWKKSKNTITVQDGAWGWGGCMEDFNNDGWVDVFQTNEYQEKGFINQSPRLFLNNAGEGLLEMEGIGNVFEEETYAGVIACVDFDRDGDVDIISNIAESKPDIFVNQLMENATQQGNESNNYLELSIVGAGGSNNGVGARIVIETENNKIVKHVIQKSGFTIKDTSVHVGLGYDKNAKVTIFWPEPNATTSVVIVTEVNRSIVISDPRTN